MNVLAFYDIVLLSFIDVERKNWLSLVHGHTALHMCTGMACACKWLIMALSESARLTFTLYFLVLHTCCYPYMCMRYPSFFITHSYLLFILYWYLSIGKLFLMIVTPSDS